MPNNLSVGMGEYIIEFPPNAKYKLYYNADYNGIIFLINKIEIELSFSRKTKRARIFVFDNDFKSVELNKENIKIIIPDYIKIEKATDVYS